MHKKLVVCTLQVSWMLATKTPPCTIKHGWYVCCMNESLWRAPERTCYQVLSTNYLVFFPNTKCWFPNTKCCQYNSWNWNMKFKSYDLKSEHCNLNPKFGKLKPEIWSLWSGISNLTPDISIYSAHCALAQAYLGYSAVRAGEFLTTLVPCRRPMRWQEAKQHK